MPENNILLIIPAFEESRRLPPFLESLGDAVAAANPSLAGNITIRVVDDGSRTEEAAAMARAVATAAHRFPFIAPIHRLDANIGKGGAVYAGWDDCDPGNARWLGFVDADGAVSPDEVVRVANQLLESGKDGNEALFAVRYPAPDGFVQRSPLRDLMGHGFSRLVRWFFRLPIEDTQCGLKFVPAAAYHRARPSFTEFRFCFDVELAYRLIEAGVRIRAIPIHWHESPGSSINVFSVLRMFQSLLRLRRQLGSRIKN